MTLQPILENSQKAQFKFKKVKRPKLIPIGFLPEGLTQLPIPNHARISYKKTAGKEQYWSFIESDAILYTEQGIKMLTRSSVYQWNFIDKKWEYHSVWDDTEPILT